MGHRRHGPHPRGARGQWGTAGRAGGFTKRAFSMVASTCPRLEAVIDLIQAQTEGAIGRRWPNCKGLSQAIGAMREELLEVLAYVEGAMEFPEEDLDFCPGKPCAKAHAVEAWMATLLDTFQTGRVLRVGVQVAIVGRPNVGKSSLFNALLAANRAIVTPIPGTTRDVLEEVANLRGYPFRLVDTAASVPAVILVEQEGIDARARAWRAPIWCYLCSMARSL